MRASASRASAGHVLAGDVLDGGRRGDLHGDVAGESDEIVVVGDEVGVAVDLDHHADLGAGMDVGLDGALGGGALAQILDLLALLEAQDLDRLIDVVLSLGERLLAVHHARAGALAQGLHVLGRYLGRAHDALVSSAGISAGAASRAAVCRRVSAGALSAGAGSAGAASVGVLSAGASAAAGAASFATGTAGWA